MDNSAMQTIQTTARSALAQLAEAVDRAPLVKELDASARPALIAHLLALSDEDRRLRFGATIGDDAIASYVEHIDFGRDIAFAVFGSDLEIVGAAHVALADEQSVRSAELGVSVLQESRGQGIGGALLGRAVTHARNAGVETLFMHCLTENRTMMHLARKAGMAIQSAGPETDAHLLLPPADAASHLQEALAEQLAIFDMRVKKQVLAIKAWLRALPEAA
jgi:GNAT superfamily N-acetyltransferase